MEGEGDFKNACVRACVRARVRVRLDLQKMFRIKVAFFLFEKRLTNGKINF